MIAREKAREAVESVHAARDTGRLSWGNINNVSNGGIFVEGPQPLREEGVDGVINTADDAAAGLEQLRQPGPDGLLGTADDELRPLIDFTREISIAPLNYQGTSNVNPNLRQITVTVRFRVDDRWRTYTLTTFISSFS